MIIQNCLYLQYKHTGKQAFLNLEEYLKQAQMYQMRSKSTESIQVARLKPDQGVLILGG